MIVSSEAVLAPYQRCILSFVMVSKQKASYNTEPESVVHVILMTSLSPDPHPPCFNSTDNAPQGRALIVLAPPSTPRNPSQMAEIRTIGAAGNSSPQKLVTSRLAKGEVAERQ